MNYTSNHHLPQWVSSDRVRMEDFNSAMANIDSGLVSASSAASRAQSAANSAQSTANSAKSAASTAQSAADAAADTASQALTKANAAYTPDNKPYVVGSYTGNGAQSQVINLGFRPYFAVISGATESPDESATAELIRYVAITGRSLNVQRRAQLGSIGLIVYRDGNYDQQIPSLNDNGRHYDYIAFR